MVKHWRVLGIVGAIALGLTALGRSTSSYQSLDQSLDSRSQGQTQSFNFLVMGGGGDPSYNEIALEKNVLYFQRTLSVLGFDPASASLFFANGNDGQATVRYLNNWGRERFKPPEIPGLEGASTRRNLSQWVANQSTDCPTFFYFTGHGSFNRRNADDNALLLWGDDAYSVRTLARLLDRTELNQSSEQPFVTMMAQCFSGSFTNLIYEGGDPDQPVALQTRCGFFATVATRPSVGCTPKVDEADYRDYSSSFFAGLSGVDRTGETVDSADYDNNGTVSFAEAHAFAKIDEQTSDWPISTVEAWLQRQVTEAERDRILNQPMADLAAISRPEQQFVLNALADEVEFDVGLSYQQNLTRTGKVVEPESYDVEQAYLMRLQMELLNVAMEDQVRQGGNPEAIAILEKLIACEASSP
ncbi:MAG: Caspase domain-containing protein [Cyanobacteria bacterium P01_A01_bin.123]